MRVPLFVKPAVKDFPGVIVDDLVSNVDIAATCIDVAGGTVPDELSDYSYSRIGTTPDPKRNGDIFIWKPVPFGAYCAIILKPYIMWAAPTAKCMI